MKNTLQENLGTCRLEIRTTERDTFIEYHLTARNEGAAPAWVAASNLFTEVATVLARHHIQPMQEKLYGFTHVREAVMRERDQAYRSFGLDRTMPATWIEGVPLQGGDFVGLQLWGIASRDGEPCVVTVDDPINGRARLWTTPTFRMLHLPCVRGTDAAGQLAAGAAAQAERMFLNLGSGAAAHGFKYTDVCRTWIYCSRLLEWYGDLNRVRTALYRKVGFDAAQGVSFPASTGIQGRCGDGEECFLDALALDSKNPSIASAAPVRCSPRQDQSFNYGSAFARGMVIDIEGRRTIHISGTASINSAGQTTHLGDAESQSLETLMCIAAILEQHGGTLENITSATLFCKTREAWEAWERVSRLLRLPPFPRLTVQADVCRDNLLVEMEAVATI